MDKDGSGFVEPCEAPVAGVGVVDEKPGRRRPAQDATARWAIGPQAQAKWIASMDRDDDGRVSEAECVAYESKVWRDHVSANWAWRQ